MIALLMISTRPTQGERPWWWKVVMNGGHVPAYALLAMACVWTLRFWRVRWAEGFAVMTAFGFGAVMEGMQRHVAGRQASFSDLVFNAIGIGLGLVMAVCLRRVSSRHRPSWFRRKTT